MCKMGCDELYEKGYISVSNGLFVDMAKTPNSSELQKYINQISGSKCDFYNEKSKTYFDWHFDNNK